MPSTIDADRLKEIEAIALAKGSHKDFAKGACVMEAVAYVAREPWSDHPECVCPVIAAFCRSWNDALPDDERNALLKLLIPKLIGTRSTKQTEERRALMAADWLVRVNTTAWLRLAGLTVHADALAALPEITSFAQVPSIKGAIEAARVDAAAAWDAARDAARDAAGAAAGAAAWAAAWDAAGAAAGAAAWDAAGDAAWDAAGAAAWDAAGDAAWDAAGAAAGAAAWAAAWDAAWDAARDAAKEKLAPTRSELQRSALVLIERMIAA